MISALQAKWTAMRKDGFVRSIGALAGGTAFAQALTVLAMPLLTRLYSPADFSILAVYSAILAIISAIACLRFEIAIPLPERDDDGANLLALALIGPMLFGLLTAAVLLIWPDQIVAVLKQPALRPFLWLFPLGVWFAGSYAAALYWATRKKNFNAIARTRVLQAVVGTGVQAGAGWFGFGPIGLLAGQLINSGAGFWGLLKKNWRADRQAFLLVRWRRMYDLFREYHRFPKYSTLEALANNAGVQLPMIIIAALAAGPEAGYLLLATKVMAAPISLIGGAVAQVYLANAPAAHRAGQLPKLTLQVISGLVKTGVGPLIFAGIIAPVVFPLVFGQEWRRAGELVAWMTPWFVMQFLASPVSMALHVTGNQRSALALQIFGCFLRVGFVILGVVLLGKFSEAYAVSGLIFYLIYIAVILRRLSIGLFDFLILLAKGWKFLLAWVFLGIFLIFVVS
ncbi:lipopolysaccharide biosynthesis protein [Variovorax sp. LT1R20]|uniref:lipopolysaccharide biosynthesis protein n=1 Tax=Variovorax sp. LT1R20 TaxID=3443729 RepID=UPI003F469BA6